MLEESSSRTRRAFIWVATGLALLVVAACFTASDSVLAGAVAATRYSASFSSLLAAAALGARAPRPIALSKRRTEWTLAFVAAHGVHFATVILRDLLEPDSKLRSFTIDVVLVVLAGVLLIAVIAKTARATSPAGRRVNAAAFYVAWTVLALVSASRARTSLASAVALGALSAAMAWRIVSRVAESRGSPGT
jgi:hypothetical protein